MTDTLEAPIAPTATLTEADLLAPVYPLPRLELTAGRGARVTGAEGRTYLDFVSGIAVNALGHAHPGLARVVARQAKQLVHCSNLFGHEPGVVLARALTRATGYSRVFFCNSGTEGIEAALKFARARARAKGLPGRDIVAFQGGFHGRTAFSLSATWTPSYREPFEPLVPGVRFAPFNDVPALDRVVDAQVAAVLVEPVQGESGAVPARQDFLEAVVARARAVGAAVILDEVQTGMGRSGQLLAQEHYGVRGDYTVLSKALGGGLPLGAVLMTDEAAATLAPGMHGCTFGGGPLVTTAGGYVLSLVNSPRFLARVRSRASSLSRGLKGLVRRHPSLASERGLGLLRAIEVAPGARYDAPALVRAARDEGLLLVRGGERAVRLLPPLNVTPKEIAEAIECLERALTRLESTSSGETK